MGKKHNCRKEIRKALEEYIKVHGLRFSKKLSGGGFFTVAAYDERTVYSSKDADKLTQEGFYLSNEEDAGLFILNFMKDL